MLKRQQHVVFSLALLFALMTCAFAQSPSGPPNQQPAADQHQAQPEQDGAKQTPFIPIEQPPQTKNESNAASTKGPKERSNAWFVGWGLSDKIAAVAIFVGFLQFAALFATVAVMRRSAHRELRAYVHIEDVKMLGMKSGKDVQIQIIPKNFGQTPAREITNTFKCFVAYLQPDESGVLVTVPPSEADFALDGAQVETVVDLAPGQKTFSTFFHPYAYWKFSYDLIDKKAAIFWVCGRIDYRDVFNRRWTTGYRRRLLVDSTGIQDDRGLVMESNAGNRTT
jgi:hypothetical protein